ncbi:hypothetical protein STRDD10_01379 [Streptococcus sp. DD10]|uniref:DUF3165 family protein n=1 Tax=Streptococcus sp. DD10 TaxID=1777878 RepID=UPI0007924143|nr:DUF3165 family protein [Streptococcus sp. DD10]KXT73756.1 hypothetical protein STRDD10_01379 [Streptococcus sp. DD10]
MFYLIIGILILLYYIFAVPESIKPTFHAVTAILLLVIFLILLVLATFRIFQLPTEYFIGALLLGLGWLAYKDLKKMPIRKKKS